MKVNIIVDHSLEQDCEKLEKQMNMNSTHIRFKVLEKSFEIKSGFIIYPTTHKKMYSTLSVREQEADYNFVFTSIPYKNNFFFEAYGTFVPFSISFWDYLTNLPVENGILYFTSAYLARTLERSLFRHQETTGCIYDFLGDKRGVDDGMRKAGFCLNCLERIENEITSDDDYKVLEDLKKLINLLSNSSKWNKSILENVESQKTPNPTFSRSVKKRGEVSVVIASPGDLIEERELLLNKLERKFRVDKHEAICGHRLVVHGWEDLASQNGYPQDIINEKIIDNVDIVLAMFKHKLGTPTINLEDGSERSSSGTVEEILTALGNNGGPLGMVYFYSKPPSPSFESENFDEMLNNWKKLQDFKATIQNKVIYKPFTSKEELVEIVCTDLMVNISDLFKGIQNE